MSIHNLIHNGGDPIIKYIAIDIDDDDAGIFFDPAVYAAVDPALVYDYYAPTDDLIALQRALNKLVRAALEHEHYRPVDENSIFDLERAAIDFARAARDVSVR